tara:strand:- start:261 stop:1004 length:744 start_codon:yes stop_codon:yes gene_type:complete
MFFGYIFSYLWKSNRVGDDVSSFGDAFTRISSIKRGIDKKATPQQKKTADFYSAFAAASSEKGIRARSVKLNNLLGKEGQGWLIDKKLSSEKVQVFANYKTKQVVVSFRGTDPADIDDIISDASLAVGLHRYNSRFKESVKIMKEIKANYMGYVSILSSHSLGGTINNFVNSEIEGIDHVYNFNPGAGVPLSYSTDSIRKNTTDYFIIGDPISVLGYGNKEHEQVYLESKADGFNHYLDQFDVIPPE